MAESTPRYRNDIDGLRALSVILVILDHLGFTWCSGGFVGVDVFFVISGYVITQTISKDASSGTFSLLAFYERRIRRLLPGLAVVMPLAVVAAWCIMLPNDFQALTSSVAAASLAVSNVYFWRQSGYFDALAITKPMLHTWSLGVEEQFYLFYPLLFTWLQKAQKKILLPTLGSLVFISLTLASITTFHHARGTFFLMPPRLWEMLIGGVVFLVFESFKPSKNVGLLFSYGGLLLIGIAAVAYSSNTLFPGLTALLPTSGAILFILAGKADYRSGAYRLMTRPPVRYIGKISYLLYLTHWPLIVLYTYYKISALGWWDKLLIVAASTLLSSGIYAFVERPIRSRAVFRKRWQPYAMATSFIVLCCLLGYIGFATGGFKQRYEGRLTQTTTMKNELSQDDNVMSRVVPIIGGTRLSSGHVDPKDVATFGWGQGPADIAVFGDSHAAHLFDGIVSEALLRRHRVQFFLNYCSPPVLNLSSWNIGGVQYNEDVVSILCNDDRIKVVILAANWTAYLKGAPYFASQAHLLQFKNEDVPPDKTFATMRSELTRTLKELRSHGKRVYVLEPLPDYGLDVLNTLQRCSVTNRDAYNYINTSRSLYLSRHAATIELLRQASSDSGCTVIPSAEALWNGTRFMLQENDISFYADHHHLSAYGSRRVAPFIFDHIVFP